VTDTAYGSFHSNSSDGDINDLQFRIRAMLMNVNTSMPVVVTAIKASGLAPVGMLTCKIAVMQLTGSGETVENVTLSNVPYLRYQGGENAVIIDPEVGDIGIVAFCQRDISGVKNARVESVPGSLRILSTSDAVYVGGILNKAPKQYVWIHGGGINVYSPTWITLEAPSVTIKAPDVTIEGAVSQSGGDVSVAQKMTVEGGATIGNIDFNGHVHGGIQPGGGDTEPPK
jgi:Phage P2 baseplate assembly protein gpV